MPDYDITISYKGSTIATMSSSGTKTLETAGTYCEDDITIDYTKTGITVVETLDPNGGTIVSISGDPVTSLQAKTVTPTSQSQTISADSGYDAISEVLVQGDSNLVSSNIASGVSIFGVTGTFQGSGGTGWETAPEEWAEALNNRTISSAYGSMVTKIGPYAFEQCGSLTTVSFPNCSIIEANAFYGCSNLIEVSFPNCVNIEYYAFVSCNKLSVASFPNCVSIGPSAFISCYRLTTASFPKCISINMYAFSQCTQLADIYFPKCTLISTAAFTNCSSLTIASFPKCQVLNNSVFYSCLNLSIASFPACIDIGTQAFYGCAKLTTAFFPKCRNIGNQAFYSCYSLTNIFFPECISINSSAFYGCNNLTEISFLKCNSVGFQAFYGCQNLEVVSLSNCFYISDRAFVGCSKLSSLYLLQNFTPSLPYSTAFNQTPLLDSTYLGYYGSIYVLSNMLNNFKVSTNWSYFSDRFVGV